MNALLALLLFIGLALVMHSVYEEKYRRLKKDVRIEYRFIPRTLYEDQLMQTDVAGLYKDMFEEPSPWAGEAAGRAPPEARLPRRSVAAPATAHLRR